MADQNSRHGSTLQQSVPSPANEIIEAGRGPQFDDIRPEQDNSMNDILEHLSTSHPEHLITFDEEDTAFLNSFLDKEEFGDFQLPPFDHEQSESANAQIADGATLMMQPNGISEPAFFMPTDQGGPAQEQDALESNILDGHHAHEDGNRREQDNHHSQQSDFQNRTQGNVEVQGHINDPQQQQNFGTQQLDVPQSQQQAELHHPPQHGSHDQQRLDTRHPQIQSQLEVQSLQRQRIYHKEQLISHYQKASFHKEQAARIDQLLRLHEQASSNQIGIEDAPVGLQNGSFLSRLDNKIKKSVNGAHASQQVPNTVNGQPNVVNTPGYISAQSLLTKRTADQFFDGEIVDVPDPKRLKAREIFHGNHVQVHRPGANEGVIYNPQPQYPPVLPSSLINENTQVTAPLPPIQIGVLSVHEAMTSTGYTLKYKSAAESRRARALRPIDYEWTPPQNDSTVPQNDYERSGYVRQLLDAVMDITTCTDSKTTGSFQKRWAKLSSGESIYSERLLEYPCWKLLSIAEELHRVGPRSLRVSDKGKLKQIEETKDLLFNERISDICALLRSSKWRCDRLVKNMEMNIVVGSPKQLLRNSVANKPSNQRKQQRLEAGRALEKQNADGLGEANNEDFMITAQSNDAQDAGQSDIEGTNVQAASDPNNRVEEVAQDCSQYPPTAYSAKSNHVQPTEQEDRLYSPLQDQSQAQPTQQSPYPTYEPANFTQGQGQAQPAQDSSYPGYKPANYTQDQNHAQPVHASPYAGNSAAQSIHGRRFEQGYSQVPDNYSHDLIDASEAREEQKRRRSTLEHSNALDQQSELPSPKRLRMGDQYGSL